jgi:hypothetical protein
MMDVTFSTFELTIRGFFMRRRNQKIHGKFFSGILLDALPN